MQPDLACYAMSRHRNDEGKAASNVEGFSGPGGKGGIIVCSETNSRKNSQILERLFWNLFDAFDRVGSHL